MYSEKKMTYNKYLVVGDAREKFKNYCNTDRIYNDHPSMESIMFTINQLRDIGYNINYFGGIKELVQSVNNSAKYPDTLFFNISDGLEQPNRKAQAAFLLEMLNVSYTGSDAVSRLISGNKHFAKKLLSGLVQSPKSNLFFSKNDVVKNLSFPVIVKPNREGSSLGITQANICYSEKELYNFIETYFSFYSEVLIEEYIAGYELTCFLIGNPSHFYLDEVLLSVYEDEMYFENFVFGIDEKSARKRIEIPASNIISRSTIAEIKSKSKEIFEVLQMRDFARIDYRYNLQNGLYFLEINGNPVISNTSEIGNISRYLNIPYAKIVSYILETAEQRINHE